MNYSVDVNQVVQQGQHSSASRQYSYGLIKAADCCTVPKFAIKLAGMKVKSAGPRSSI
jgi:hypothetical protein